MQAMILAAGFGTRLRPHTLVRPKPLFPILNKPLLLLTIQRLRSLGFDRIVVNCHYLREQIVATVSRIDGVIVQEEETILGTGGGLRTALSLFENEPILVTNGDIYHTIDFVKLYNEHVDSGNMVTLAMHDYPRFNSVPVRDNKVVGFQQEGAHQQLLAFTGVHVVNPVVLGDMEADTYSCIVEHYKNILGYGTVLTCYRTDECFWTDMGTPDDYIQLHEGLLSGSIPVWDGLLQELAGKGISARAILAEGVSIRDWASIGGAKIGAGSQLSRVIAWDGVEILPDSNLCDCIVSS